MLRLGARDKTKITVTVNGTKRIGHAEPRTLLCDFLRHEIGLYGTHVGCEHGVCGACTVLIDGRAERSCLTLAVQVDGRSITTVEGLGDGDSRGGDGLSGGEAGGVGGSMGGGGVGWHGTQAQHAQRHSPSLIGFCGGKTPPSGSYRCLQ